jgi:thiamine kinase-like enzyme
LQYGNILQLATKDLLLIDYEYSSYVNRGFDIANHFCEWAADYHSDEPHRLDFRRFPSAKEQQVFFDAYLDARDCYLAQSSSLQSSSLQSSISSLQTPPLPPNEPKISSDDETLQLMQRVICDNSLASAPLLLQQAFSNHQIRPSPRLSPSLSPMLTPQALSTLRQLDRQHLVEETRRFVPVSHLLWSLWGFIQAAQSTIDFDFLEYSRQRLVEFNRLFAQV